MKKFTIIPLVILLCFTFGCQQGEEVVNEGVFSGLSDEDIAAIKTVFDNYIHSVLEADWDAFAAVFTEDAVVMPPNVPLIQGREAIKTYQASFPPVAELAAQITEIDGNGDLAYARCSYFIKIEIEGAPEPIQDTGKLLSILRKQKDGSWLFAIDIYNSDIPFPAPPKEE